MSYRQGDTLYGIADTQDRLMDMPHATTLCRRSIPDNPPHPVRTEPVEGPLPSEDATAQTLDSECFQEDHLIQSFEHGSSE